MNINLKRCTLVLILSAMPTISAIANTSGTAGYIAPPNSTSYATQRCSGYQACPVPSNNEHAPSKDPVNCGYYYSDESISDTELTWVSNCEDIYTCHVQRADKETNEIGANAITQDCYKCSSNSTGVGGACTSPTRSNASESEAAGQCCPPWSSVADENIAGNVTEQGVEDHLEHASDRHQRISDDKEEISAGTFKADQQLNRDSQPGVE